MNTIIKINETGLVSTNQIFKTKDKEKFMIKFPRGFWNLFYNKYRDETIEKINNEDESDEIKRYHGNVNNVPIYIVYKNGEIVDIPVGTKHRVENRSEEDLIFIETQTGTYFGEDDIVRIEDDYGRNNED